MAPRLNKSALGVKCAVYVRDLPANRSPVFPGVAQR